ncbi:anti-sigma factor domain-containing protein [Paenibacillus thalictri]|uniref:Anti-sigma factor domain-containing protein n=1 Tax=Paenibacillus thalictri TaxID=2527873 RepID=A0A4Q9DG71_9BACL|nr:anti-sigma factor domain-containing protein [Paenibacillus thalictri]TBL70558.1 anti-sigma factor domain-containing protein [Paenibacillus thalictri]
MNKGVVMEITDKHIIVMTPEGQFEKLARKKRQCDIGEEIVFASTSINWRSPSVAGKSALAAAVVFCLVLFGSFAGKLGTPDVVAYVSMDINPSVELGIDDMENVIELRGLNQDGAELIQAVEFKNKKLEDVTGTLLDKAEQKSLAKGEGEIVIASTTVKEQAKVSDVAIAQRLKQQVESHIKTTHPDRSEDYQVTAFAAPQEIRDTASQNGLSMGKYAVYLNAKNNGAEVTVDDFKKESVLQIAKEKGAENVVTPSAPPSKAAMKQLMAEEKSGKLDKKVEEAKKEREKNNTNKNNTNTKQTGGTNTNQHNGSNNTNSNNKNDGKTNTGTSGATQGKPAVNGAGGTNQQGNKTQTPATKPGNQDNKKDDPKKDDNKKDDNKKDDNKKDDNKKDDNKKDDNKKDDPRKDDPKKDDSKRDDPRKNDPKKEDDNKKQDDKKQDTHKQDDDKKNDNKKDDNNSKNDKNDNGKNDNDSKSNNKGNNKKDDSTTKDDNRKDDNRKDNDNKKDDNKKDDSKKQDDDKKR